MCGSLIKVRLLNAVVECCQDPLEMVRQKCQEAEHCVHTRERLEECENRVGSRSLTDEDCTEELFDFLHARDHCVSMTSVHCIRQKAIAAIEFIYNSYFTQNGYIICE